MILLQYIIPSLLLSKILLLVILLILIKDNMSSLMVFQKIDLNYQIVLIRVAI